jgi:hypothetical protein
VYEIGNEGKGLNVMAYELAPRADSSAGVFIAWEEPFVNFSLLFNSVMDEFHF